MRKRDFFRLGTKVGRKAFLRGKSVFSAAEAGYKRSRNLPGQKALFSTRTERRFEAFFSKTSNRGDDLLLLGAGVGSGLFIDHHLDERKYQRRKKQYNKHYKMR